MAVESKAWDDETRARLCDTDLRLRPGEGEGGYAVTIRPAKVPG